MPDAAPPAPAPQSKRSSAFALLVATVGLGTASTLMLDTKSDEGVVNSAYPDLGGVWSICSGSTHGVKPGEVDSAAQCDARTAADLVISARAVLACAPALRAPERHEQLRAAVRFNNNTGHFCASSGAKLMRAGKYRAGCDALLAYDGIVAAKPIRGAVKVRRLASGKYFSEIRGLMNRRAAEHAVCVKGL